MSKKERLGLGSPVRDLAALRVAAAPWAKGCAAELTRLWNAMIPKMRQHMIALHVPLADQLALIDEAKETFWAHHKQVLDLWTQPYVESLLDQEPPSRAEAKASAPSPSPEAVHHG